MTTGRESPPPDYHGTRCLVLGADGFIGRWVACALARAHAEVHVSSPDGDRARRVMQACAVDARVWEADLLPAGNARGLLDRVEPDHVFNAAGYGVDPSESDEAVARRLNADLVRELCDALRHRASRTAAPPVLVHIGSAAEYGDAGGDLDEEGDARPITLYGTTKLAGTLHARRAAREDGVHAVVARSFTVYGPGEHPHRLLPTLIAAARSGAAVPLSAGLQLRDFAYVEDVAEGLVRLGRTRAAAGQVVNLATGTLLAVRDFVLTAARILGITPQALRFGALGEGRHDLVHDPVRTDRLESLVGWRPPADVEAGVRRTIAHGAGGVRNG